MGGFRHVGTRFRLRAAAAAVCVALTAVSVPAHAGPVIPRLPKTNPVNYTPRVVDDARFRNAGVRELRQVGSTMYAGGEFRTVLNAARTKTYHRSNIFAFRASNGKVLPWRPSVDGAVYALEPSSDGRYLYVGGDFSEFAGVLVHGLVKYDLKKDRVVRSFAFPVDARRVSDLQLVDGRLFVAGIFPGGIVAVSPTTGATTDYFDATQASGQQPGYSTRVYRFAVSPDATRMVVIGSFTTVGGQPRPQVAQLDLGADAAEVDAWSAPTFGQSCSPKLGWYTRDVDWTPDGKRFAVVTSGGGYGVSRMCDSVSMWSAEDMYGLPVWTNYSGGDTFHSVTVTDRAVFVSGHFRWLNNPQGKNSKGPGGVSRRGIGAINPTTGLALSWNPTKSVEGGRGGFDLYFTKRGLWVAHFEKFLGTSKAGPERHEGLGLLPY